MARQSNQYTGAYVVGPENCPGCGALGDLDSHFATPTSCRSPASPTCATSFSTRAAVARRAGTAVPTLPRTRSWSISACTGRAVVLQDDSDPVFTSVAERLAHRAGGVRSGVARRLVATVRRAAEQVICARPYTAVCRAARGERELGSAPVVADRAVQVHLPRPAGRHVRCGSRTARRRRAVRVLEAADRGRQGAQHVERRRRARSAPASAFASARKLRGGYVPAGGKLIELQAYERRRWRASIATPRTRSRSGPQARAADREASGGAASRSGVPSRARIVVNVLPMIAVAGVFVARPTDGR